MSEDMLREKLVRELPGLTRDFLKKVLGDNGKEWVDAFKLFLKKQNPWPEKSLKPTNKRYKVLRELEQIAEFPETDTFKVADHLRLTQRATADLIIGYLYNIGDNFLNKIEKDIPASRLRAYTLKKDSLDNLIIADLGGEESAETTFAEMIALMRAQGRGQKGILLTNGYANIFYIRDAKGVLWAIYCRWSSVYGCWIVYVD